MNNQRYDALSLNAILFDKRAPYNKQIPFSVRPHGMWYYVIRVLYAIVKEAVKIILKFPINQWLVGIDWYGKYYKGNNLFLATSTNNMRALELIIDRVRKEKENIFVFNEQNTYRCFPRIMVLICSLRSCFRTILTISRLPPYERRIAGYYISNIFLSTGYNHVCRKLLSKYRPFSVIMTNDHVYNTKALALICEDLDIKTVYVQHASVSYAFPELHFSYSFLDGLDSFEKYTAEGKKVYGEAILLGALRYDKLSDYRLRRRYNKRNCIGISINKLDDSNKIVALCQNLLEKYPNIILKIRSHPSIKRNPLDYECDRLLFTRAKDEGIIDYLDSIDLQISGDSGVHFDALLGGVPSLAYNFSSFKYGDNYKYVEKQLVRYAENFQQVSQFIEENDESLPVPSQIRFYDESYGKSYAGHSSEIVGNLITSGFDFDQMRRQNKMESKDYNGNKYWVISC